MFTNLLKSSFSALTGALLFIQIYNRFILHMKHGNLKSTICYTAMITLPGGLFIFTMIYNSNHVMSGILFLFISLSIIEIRQRYRRFLLRTSLPSSSILIIDKSKKNKIFENTTNTLIVREYTPEITSWTGPAVKIAQLSDIHVDQLKNISILQSAIRYLAETKPDLIFLTGDYTDDLHYMSTLSDLIQKLAPPLGIFACMGNHDHWGDYQQIQSLLEKAGVIFPSAKGSEIKVGLYHSIHVHRLEFPYNKTWTYKPVSSTDLNIVLSHTPDNFFRIADQGADLVFSGHLHGGQWRIPWFGSVISPSTQDRLFDMGHFKTADTNMFVSAGLGHVWIPMRINCPAEILLVNLSEGSSLSDLDFSANLYSQDQPESLAVLNTAQQVCVLPSC